MTLTEQVIEALKPDFDEVYQVGYEQGYADASNGTTTTFESTVPTDSTDEVEQIINAGKIELDGVYQAGYEKGYAEGSGGSSETILFYDDFEDGLVDRWFQTTTSTQWSYAIADDSEQGKVLSVSRLSVFKARELQSVSIPLSTDVTSINVSLKIRNDSETAEGTFYVEIVEYNEDESQSVETYLTEEPILISALEWVEISNIFNRTEGYNKVAIKISTPRTTRVAYSIDDIKITY